MLLLELVLEESFGDLRMERRTFIEQYPTLYRGQQDVRKTACTVRCRAATGESRSALVSRALGRLLPEQEHQARLAEYVEAYRRTPERPDEIELARTSARDNLAALEWDDA